MIDWENGYSVYEWRLMRFDEVAWVPKTQMFGVENVSIERSSTDDVSLLESASLNLTRDAGDEFEEGWYQLDALFVDFSGGFERQPIMTMLCESGSSSTRYHYDDVSVSGYSVLQPVSERKFLAGEYVPKGTDGVQYVKDLLKGSTPAPVVTSGSFVLDSYLVFDANISYLQAAWEVLTAGGWCMQIGGDGTIYVVPKPTESKLDLSTAGAKLVSPGVSKNFDLHNVKNRYYAIEGGETAVATNTDPDSKTSYQRRGRWIDEVDLSPTRLYGETLLEYAERMLQGESTVVAERQYTRDYRPDVHPFDIVTGSTASIGFDGELRILSQSLECGKGIKVKEKSGQEITLWRATT